MSVERGTLWARLYPLLAPTTVVLLIGLLIFARARSMPSSDRQAMVFQSARELPARTLLRAGDLRRPRDIPLGFFWLLPDLNAMTGRYLSTLHHEGTPILPTELHERPELPDAQTPVIAVSLKDDPVLARWLNADSKVDVCIGDGECIAPGAQVWAVVCENSPDVSNCHAIVVLTREQKQAVVKAAAKIRLVVEAL